MDLFVSVLRYPSRVSLLHVTHRESRNLNKAESYKPNDAQNKGLTEERNFLCIEYHRLGCRYGNEQCPESCADRLMPDLSADHAVSYKY